MISQFNIRHLTFTNFDNKLTSTDVSIMQNPYQYHIKILLNIPLVFIPVD